MYTISDLDLVLMTTIVSFATALIGAIMGVVVAEHSNDKIDELENKIRKLKDQVEALDGVVDVLIAELKKGEEAEEAEDAKKEETDAEQPEETTAATAAATAAMAEQPAKTSTSTPATPLQQPVVPEEIVPDINMEKEEHASEKLQREFHEAQSILHNLVVSGATAVAIAGVASWSYYLYQSPLLRGAIVPSHGVY
jgi:TolA-binding protein